MAASEATDDAGAGTGWPVNRLIGNQPSFPPPSSVGTPITSSRLCTRLYTATTKNAEIDLPPFQSLLEERRDD